MGQSISCAIDESRTGPRRRNLDSSPFEPGVGTLSRQTLLEGGLQKGTHMTITSVGSAVVTTAPVEVTPELARLWLEFNVNNRHVNPSRVAQIARDMSAGLWKQNGDSIRFDREGRLIDGQHRLLAVIESGKSLSTFVVRGLEPEAQTTIDTGQARSAGQQLHLLGFSNATKAASVVVTLWRLIHAPDKVWAVSNMPSKAEQIEFAMMHRDAITRAVNYGSDAWRELRAKISAYGAAAAYIELNGRAEEFGDFHTTLLRGSNLAPGDPRLEYRSRLAKSKSIKSAWDTQAWAAMTVKAFNAYVTGKDIKTLRFTRDHLPMPPVA